MQLPLLRSLTFASACLLWGFAASAASPAISPIAPFSSNGCSRFPDRAPIGNADWCHCCLAHDLAYWRGGSAEERLSADASLRSCVEQATGNTALAQTMYAGVRAGGSPVFNTPYRWGYGWPYGRNYAPLTTAERTASATLQAEYLARNPALACSK